MTTEAAAGPSPATPAEWAELDEAVRHTMAGRFGEAEAGLRDVIARNPALLEAHAQLGMLLFQRDRCAEAAVEYERCIALNPEVSAFHFNLGTAQEKLGDLEGATGSYLAAWRRDPANAMVALFAGAALEAAGRRETAAAMFSLGADCNGFVRSAKDDPRAHPEMRRRSEVADRVIREYFTRQYEGVVDAAERTLEDRAGAKPDLSRVRSALWPKTHDGEVKFRTALQAPSIFYMPDLPARSVTPREALPWAGVIEAATAEVREEYLAAVKAGVAFSPYVHGARNDAQWQALQGKLDWSTLHLFKEARETPIAKHFPKTLKALEAADVVRVDDGKAIEMFFSRLKPGAHIPPHFGCANNRITVHLPLIVPDGCAIRVGRDMHHWREGELFAFDDSFEHEAWNRSSEDRVVLIFESHHPDLTADERYAVEQAFEVRGLWERARHDRMVEAAGA
jgi:aspartyl/asparaginyl beta-hydroxylase (cupin superfamily)